MPDAAVNRRTAWFGAGLAAVAVAMAPPLEAATERRLSAHMVQHLMLMLAAAPLLATGLRPGPGFLDRHRFVARIVLNPVVVLTVFVGGFWMWHLPQLYDAALSNRLVHILEHGTFLGGSFLFWAVVLDTGPQRRLGLGATCGFVFAAMVTNIWLAAALTFSTTPLYTPYLTAGAGAALADQQLAGVVMWVPGDIVYFVTLLALFRRLLADVDIRMRARDAVGGAGR
jgi:cytochrome c oxidase assembly factor CtaG